MPSTIEYTTVVDEGESRRASQRARGVANVLYETAHESPGTGAGSRWWQVRPLDAPHVARERLPVRYFAECAAHRRVLGISFGPGAIEGRFQLDRQLLDDLDLALGGNAEWRQVFADVTSPVHSNRFRRGEFS